MTKKVLGIIDSLSASVCLRNLPDPYPANIICSKQNGGRWIKFEATIDNPGCHCHDEKFSRAFSREKILKAIETAVMGYAELADNEIGVIYRIKRKVLVPIMRK